jgi:bifunctional UDP-N-acetylglucosamine pyrophosphorylase/glucosamine-1-phosphate N-acetyltransferase
MSTNPLSIVILAAGKGTRMQSALPKVMHKIAGAPMITWLLRTVEGLHPERVIVVVGPGMADLEKTVAPHKTVVQQKQQGTADAVSAALPLLSDFDGDVLILMGDTPLVSLTTLQNLIAARKGAGLSVLATALENPAGYGRVILGADDTLKRIVEDKDASPEERAVNLVNTGAFCIDGAKLAGWLQRIGNDNAQGEYYLTDLPQVAASQSARSRVCVTTDVAEVRGCNTRADLAALEYTAQQYLRHNAMLSGVTMIDPQSVYLQLDTQIAPDVTIDPHVVFGPGVEIATGAHIKSFSHVEGAKIGANVSVGPFARLRPGSEIGDDVRIGNFVEVKKSKIGARSKINHLAYVGDCLMGDDTNFSAGAITVNYDGFEKHRTVIGKGVMIGSNVNLVAPVHIDDGAFIAAGSTVTKDVPADALSIGRDASKIRKGWAAEYRRRKKALAEKLKSKKPA